MTDRSFPRRRALGAMAAALGLAPVAAAAATRTPPQVAGPFYPREGDRFADADNDLVRIEGRVREAGGTVLHLSGRVLDRAGQPLARRRVEIWQCDVNGRYLHPGDRGGAARDPAFQGFGATMTDEDGRYAFRTILPVPYPGRTPHIHALVERADGTFLTTQIYISEDPRNARDFIFRSLGRAGREAASMTVTERSDGDADGQIDFVV